jgi:hypothetical protein
VRNFFEYVMVVGAFSWWRNQLCSYQSFGHYCPTASSRCHKMVKWYSWFALGSVLSKLITHQTSTVVENNEHGLNIQSGLSWFFLFYFSLFVGYDLDFHCEDCLFYIYT